MTMNKILVVVDVQNDFVSGTLGTEEAQEIIPSVIAKIEEYRRNGYGILATKDTHFEETYFKTQEGRYLPVYHCINKTWGWELVEGVRELIKPSDEWCKYSFGSMNAMRAVAKVANEQKAEVEFIGLCTDICVIANVILLKTISPETKISVDSKCCAGVTKEKHEAALETMRSLQIEVL